MHVSLYHAALAKCLDDPITLSEADFAVLKEFGGKGEAARASARTTSACSSSASPRSGCRRRERQHDVDSHGAVADGMRS